MRLHFGLGPGVDLLAVHVLLPELSMHGTNHISERDWLRGLDKLDDDAVSVLPRSFGQRVELAQDALGKVQLDGDSRFGLGFWHGSRMLVPSFYRQARRK